MYRVFIANSFSYEAQYRADTWIKLLTNFLWVGMLLLTIEIVFQFTSGLGGWSKEQVYLMTVFWIMADELFVAFFSPGLSNLSTTISQGDLDVFLTKPVSALFLVSCKLFLMRAFYRFVTQLLILGFLVYQYDFALSWWHALVTGALLIIAVSVDYSRVLIANIFAFWFERIENVNDAIGMISGIGRYPLDIFPRTIKILTFTLVPIAFSAYVPTATLTGKWPWYAIAYAFIFAAFLFTCAVLFWNYAVRRYSSASS